MKKGVGIRGSKTRSWAGLGCWDGAGMGGLGPPLAARQPSRHSPGCCKTGAFCGAAPRGLAVPRYRAGRWLSAPAAGRALIIMPIHPSSCAHPGLAESSGRHCLRAACIFKRPACN